MSGFLLDSNHISAAERPISSVRERMGLEHRKGTRFGTITPVVCELMAGMQTVVKRHEFRRALKKLLSLLRLWPVDLDVAQHYGEVYQELRGRGRVLSPVDMMLAATARHLKVVILTTDRDFEALPDLRTENWLL